MMKIERISAFSSEGMGGNPAGVVLLDTMLPVEKMQNIAAEVGYSETVFAVKKTQNDTNTDWRVRYFSPETEVPFCGHATIALGAVLAEACGDNTFDLELNDAQISVRGTKDHDAFKATLTSPPTQSSLLSCYETSLLLDLFGYSRAQLDPRLPPAAIHAGADHYVFALRKREDLRHMVYDFDEGKAFMRKLGLVTIMLVWIESESVFHSRNAFASGGLMEDPATGAATAAFSGYLRDRKWPKQHGITLIQGEDMGRKSIINAHFCENIGSSIRVSGRTHKILI